MAGHKKRLRENGFTYRDLVDRIRHDQATTMLADVSISVSDIARHLGYTELSNFTHAFVRWTGISPTEYRSRTTAE
jgi:AraC-like DNA-binding protein